MSNRTLLEFNHDFLYRIEKRPEEFVKLLLEQMGTTANRERIEFGLKVGYGVTLHGTRHHTDHWKKHINTDGAK